MIRSKHKTISKKVMTEKNPKTFRQEGQLLSRKIFSIPLNTEDGIEIKFTIKFIEEK
jgi:hypothetical protein